MNLKRWRLSVVLGGQPYKDTKNAGADDSLVEDTFGSLYTGRECSSVAR